MDYPTFWWDLFFLSALPGLLCLGEWKLYRWLKKLYTWTKKNHEILAALQHKPLYNISRSEKWGKKNKPRLIMAHVRYSLMYIPSSLRPHPLTTALVWGVKFGSGKQACLMLLVKVKGVFNFTMLISFWGLVPVLCSKFGCLIISFIQIFCLSLAR